MEEVTEREDNSDKIKKKKKKKKKKVKICEAITCKRSQGGGDTAQGKAAEKSAAKSARRNEAKTVGTAAEKRPKVRHAGLGESKERRAKGVKVKEVKVKEVKVKEVKVKEVKVKHVNVKEVNAKEANAKEANAKETNTKEINTKETQLKRVHTKGDRPESDPPEGDRPGGEDPQNAQQKRTGGGSTLKKVAEQSDSALGEEPLGGGPGAIPSVKRKGGSSRGDASKRGSSGGDASKRGSSQGDASKRGSSGGDASKRGSSQGDASKRGSSGGNTSKRGGSRGNASKRDAKTEAHKNERCEGTPRRSHKRERNPPVRGMIDGPRNPPALSCSESSTLSLASGATENSSLYWEDIPYGGGDSLIEVFIGEAKLDSHQTKCSHYEQAFCVSYFVYEDPLEIFSLFQGVSWLPELRNRCTSLNRIEFKPKRNIKRSCSSAYLNFQQSVHLRRRHNEVLNIVDDGIAYVFISIVGVNLKEYEQFYEGKYGTMKGGTAYAGTPHISSAAVKPLIRPAPHWGVPPNMGEEYQRGAEDVPFGKNLVESFKKEVELEMDLMGEKKIITERDHQKFLHILGSSIVPIKVCNGEAKGVHTLCTRDSYHVYPHEVIRAVLYNYLDLFRKNKKANLFHLISKHEQELSPVGRLNLQSREVKREVPPHKEIPYEEDLLHNLSSGKSDAYNIAKEIFKYITISRTGSRRQEKDSFVKKIKNLCSYLDVELNKRDSKLMNRSFSFLEKCLHKMDEIKGQEKFMKKIRKNFFKMLGLSKRRFPNGFSPSRWGTPEVPCSHLIVYVHCVANITLKWSSLKRFIDGDLFQGVIFWEEEGDSLHNLQNVKDRKRRTIKLASHNGIQADYYFATECGGREKQDVVCLKLNFNSPVILPYNYNAPSCRLSFVLLHDGAPLLRLGGSDGSGVSGGSDGGEDSRHHNCYAINDNVPFNEGDKVKRSLQTHAQYLKEKGLDPFTEKSRPFVELSFYTHPKNGTFFSAPKYRLLYKNQMKSNLGENTTLSSYAAPNFGRDQLVFHFFDDFADDLRVGRANRRSPFKSHFFVPIVGGEVRGGSPEGRRADAPLSGAQLRGVQLSGIQLRDAPPRDFQSRDTPNQVVHFAVAEGAGLRGGEINTWHSFHVHTKNCRNRKVYGGRHVQIRIQIEPLGYPQLEYAADLCRNAEVSKSTLSGSSPEKGLMGPGQSGHSGHSGPSGHSGHSGQYGPSGQFCFNSFSGIHELVDYSVEDLKNGSYQVTYQVHQVGRKLLYIFCDGIDVVGSPYEIKATPSGADPKLCKILGKGATQCLATPVLDLRSGPWGGKRQRGGGNMVVNQGHNEGHNQSVKEGLAPSGGNLDGAAPAAHPGGNPVEDGPSEARPGETPPICTASATASATAPTATPHGEHELHIIAVTKREEGQTEGVSTECAREEALGSSSAPERTPYRSDEAEKPFPQPKYYDEIKGENITQMDEANKQRFAQLLEESQIVNTFTVIIFDKNGVKLHIGNDSVKVVGKRGAQIKRVVDNGDGSYTVEYVAHFKREEKTKKMFDEEVIKEVQNFYDELLIQCSRKYKDNHLIEIFKKKFHRDIPICCQIHVYINEVEMFGSPLKPIIMNIPQILHFFNLYFQFTYSGMLLKSFENLLSCNDYQGCVSTLSSFCSSFFGGGVDNEEGHSKLGLPRFAELVSSKGIDEKVKPEKLFFHIPLNIRDLRKEALAGSASPVGGFPYGQTKWGEQQKGAKEEKCAEGSPLLGGTSPQTNESSFMNEWLHMHMLKSKLAEKEQTYDLGMNLAYSLSNIILHHLVYLKEYKFFINAKQYENGLLQNNILTQFRKLLEEEYKKMFAYQTNNIIGYCQKIGNVKFSSLEELLKVYKGIAFELRKLKKNHLADEFDKCCEHMCQELYLHNIESNLLRKEAMLDKYEQVIDQKMEKVSQMKEGLKKYQQKEVDLDRISKLCSVKRDRAIQTNDYLSYKNSFLSALIESRREDPSVGEAPVKSAEANPPQMEEPNEPLMDEPNEPLLEESHIRRMVRRHWRNASTYDIFLSVKNTMKNCPRLKTSLDETFNYYSCSVKRDNKMKDFQLKKMQEIKMVENLDNLKGVDLSEDHNNLLPQNEMSSFHLTYNAYVALLIDLRCNKFFVNDLENVLWLFEKFSIQHHSFRKLYNPYGFLRVIPKYLFIAFVRELAYLNMLYVICECAVTNKEDEQILLNTNHPSRLSSFHHFVKYHFVPFYEELSLEPNFQNFKQNLIEHNEEELHPDSTRDDTCDDTCASGGGRGGITTTSPTHVHINLLDLETYFNNELPLLVRHRNFEKTFPLLFDHYAGLSPPQRACDGAAARGGLQGGDSAANRDNRDNAANPANLAYQVPDGVSTTGPEKHISVAIFIRFLREFGLIPHFFSNQMAIRTLQSFMQKKGKKKLNYEDFSHAIILSLCECVKKNIFTQYNLLKGNNQLNSKIQTEKILNPSYIQYEAKELIYLFGFADLQLVRSKLAG
ncbi:hypothetical protein, conserved [Plasmodium vivax]|uniref:Uncharacterized protein n=1 Tax=Plasmodium vivax (strain Salvador I) TaxID=126793 RepID=A5K4G3_PLAVS|nr:hypothetical protein, conserved [Plasmodium vivax]EDL45541.1 hypothetical protein, conserved [Plasmodium vivax]|eukprot:XP_001615268.1 hypothetical protein [Plasmodium vivax Sal-1]